MSSTRNPTHGTKVSTDPTGKVNTIHEGAGPVTSDSLAAESVRSGGGFASNRDSEPLGVKGANSTFNTTDTSAATELPPTRSGPAREGPNEPLQPEQSERKQHTGDTQSTAGTEAGQGGASETRQKSQHGGQQQGGSEQGGLHQGGQDQGGQQQQPQTSSGAKSSDVQSSGAQGSGDVGDSEHGKHHGTTRDRHHKHLKEDDEAQHQPGVAPSYVEADVINRVQHAKPKGKNLKEGDIDDDAPNASFSGEIGTDQDPGRLAEQRYQLYDNESARDLGPRDKKIKGGTPYDALPTDEQA